jgi:hypothetical protein
MFGICLAGSSDTSAPFYDQMNGHTARRLDRSNLYGLNVKRDSHLIADEGAAGLECPFLVRPKSLRLILVVAETPSTP